MKKASETAIDVAQPGGGSGTDATKPRREARPGGETVEKARTA
jgi:hypothetical protein